MSVIRWIFDFGGASPYTFTRNPDRSAGDSYWVYEQRGQELDVIGASLPTYQIDGFKGAIRSLRFTAITGSMMRTLQTYYLNAAVIPNCRDHLYPTSPEFNCIIIEFTPTIHPAYGSFPGSGEDTYDLDMALMRIS